MMSRQKWIFLIVAFLMMGGTAGVLAHLKTNQKLGLPGVKTTPRPDSLNPEVALPEHVLDFTSERTEQDTNVVHYLPDDTCFGGRRYFAPDGSWVQASVVLMGADRTSIHKPKYCLPGHGWRIDSETKVSIPLDDPQSSQLPVMKWLMTTLHETQAGQKVELRGIYVFWFVADGEQTVVHSEIMWRIALGLLRTGMLQRWAYVSFFSVCAPGQEEATFERMKKVIAASVPEFQLTSQSKDQIANAQR